MKRKKQSQPIQPLTTDGLEIKAEESNNKREFWNRIQMIKGIEFRIAKLQAQLKELKEGSNGET